jgi:glycosyltransferase involved in cell wall biosynthesis
MARALAPEDLSTDESALRSPRQSIAVVIGRNEGERLKRCLRSLLELLPVIYVDSGSTDESVSFAESNGAHVVNLDMSRPFTAARARNAGVAELLRLYPQAKYVQFVDGDCEVLPGWLATAEAFLDQRPEVAVVCGRRFERFPEATIYNRLIEDEWNTPLGEAESCGGDSLVRVYAFQQVGGFADDQMAHEEPELCSRLRQACYHIWRADAPMTVHDADMTNLRQYYQRNRRAGFGITQYIARRGRCADRSARIIIQRALTWSIALPLSVLILTVGIGLPALLLVLLYPVQIFRHALQDKQGVGGGFDVRTQAASLAMIGKFGEAHGTLTFLIRTIRNKQGKSITYK